MSGSSYIMAAVVAILIFFVGVFFGSLVKANSATNYFTERPFNQILTLAAFAWGIYTYRDTAKKKLTAQKDDARRTAETKRIEATLPYLNKQLQLYTEATKVTATIATSTDSQEVDRATKRFEELYYGELALVERIDVANAMFFFERL